MTKAKSKPSLYHHEALAQHDVRRVAVAAVCDPRVVIKYLRAMPLQQNMERRIVMALRACELAHLIRDDDASGVKLKAAVTA